MVISKALLKYGHAGFKLEILEFCSSDVLLVREQYFIDKTQPEYNILKIAGNSLGYKHTEATKKLLSESKKNSVLSETTRELIRVALKGRVFSPETIEKRSTSSSTRQSVIITNIQTGEIKEFISLGAASLFLGITRYMLEKHGLNNNPCKGYKIEILDEADRRGRGYGLPQPITLTNKETGENLEFFSMGKAAEHLKISQPSLKNYLENKNKIKTIKGYEVNYSSIIHKDVRKNR